MSEEIRWEKPTTDGRSRHRDYEPIAAALRGNPGAWAVLSEDSPSSLAVNLRQGKYKAFRPVSDYEATTRHLPEHAPNRARIYVRFVGKVES